MSLMHISYHPKLYLFVHKRELKKCQSINTE